MLSRLKQLLRVESFTRRGSNFSESVQPPKSEPVEPGGVLVDRFRAIESGQGMWKWEHYFPAYERHLARFVGRSPVVLEIGIYSGGSLPFWKDYLGARVIGVDINPRCKSYATEGTEVFVGDQGDRGFWRSLDLPPLDIVIDDGGHLPEQQIVTLEELLPRMADESVYICEDVHGTDNDFTDYVHGLVKSLNAARFTGADADLGVSATSFQRSVHSIHHYPFLTVIEKSPGGDLRAPKRGTIWEPSQWLS